MATKLYEVTDCCIDCYVLATSPEQARSFPEVLEYFCDSLDNLEEPLEANEMPSDRDLTIALDGEKVTMSVEAWIESYTHPTASNKSVILCSSEY